MFVLDVGARYLRRVHCVWSRLGVPPVVSALNGVRLAFANFSYETQRHPSLPWSCQGSRWIQPMRRRARRE